MSFLKLIEVCTIVSRSSQGSEDSQFLKKEDIHCQNQVSVVDNKILKSYRISQSMNQFIIINMGMLSNIPHIIDGIS